MNNRNVASGLKNLDWITLSLYLSLVAIGWLMIYAVSYEEGQGFTEMVFSLDNNVGKQTMFIGISLVMLLLLLFIDWNFWRIFAYLIYATTMIMLVLVLVIGKEINNATSWFAIAGFTLQPSEFAKLGACLAMSAYLSTYSTQISQLKSQVTAIGLFLLPIILIMMQPDAGSALVFVSFLIVLFREGFNANVYILGISVTVVSILGLVFNPIYILFGLALLAILAMVNFQKKKKFYWLLGFMTYLILSISAMTQGLEIPVLAITGVVLVIMTYLQYQGRRRDIIKPMYFLLLVAGFFAVASNYTSNKLPRHQQDRLNSWLQPSKADPKGALYNVIQSKNTIGSGGLQGKGFLEGTMTKLNYVPEQSTDFIFCTVGEEQGFVGTVGIVGLFLLFLLRITVLAERQRADFSRYYAYSFAGILFVHFFVNIGMTMGLVPVIGIPLPFISYGGSSILAFTMMTGILLSLDSNRLTA